MTQDHIGAPGQLRLRSLLFTFLAVAALSGCSVTSPYWGYTPETTSTPIPFQVFSVSNASVQVECANDTGGHGNPTNGDASYIWAATLNASSEGSLDSLGNRLYSLSKNVTLPRACWKWFDLYGFWQANVRVVFVNNDGRKLPYPTYDLAGLECLGREVGKTASWYGAANKGCEKRYSNVPDLIPYVVMRINGYAAGANYNASARSSGAQARIVSFASPAQQAPAADGLARELPAVTKTRPFTPELMKQLQQAR